MSNLPELIENYEPAKTSPSDKYPEQTWYAGVSDSPRGYIRGSGDVDVGVLRSTADTPDRVKIVISGSGYSASVKLDRVAVIALMLALIDGLNDIGREDA